LLVSRQGGWHLMEPQNLTAALRLSNSS